MSNRERRRAHEKSIQEAMASCAAKGLIYDSGLRRDGLIVWMLTPKGEELARKLDAAAE